MKRRKKLETNRKLIPFNSNLKRYGYTLTDSSILILTGFININEADESACLGISRIIEKLHPLAGRERFEKGGRNR